MVLVLVLFVFFIWYNSRIVEYLFWWRGFVIIMFSRKTKINFNTGNGNRNDNKTRFRDRKQGLYTLKGGKFLDKGGFGCVVAPALKCTKKDKNIELLKRTHRLINEFGYEFVKPNDFKTIYGNKRINGDR